MATIGSDSCGGTGSYTFEFVITQEANTLNAASDNGDLRGTIFGSRIQMSGILRDIDEGNLTLQVTLTVSADGNTMQGSHTYIWYGGGISDCVGSGSLRATRL